MSLRKIKECICAGLEKFETGDDSKMLPLCFGWFLRNMTIILLLDSKTRLSQDTPVSELGGYISGGKAKLNPTLDDIIHVLNHDDLLRGTGQSLQLHDFLDWFLDQEEPDDDSGMLSWDCIDFLAKKWNEFAEIRGHAHEPEE